MEFGGIKYFYNEIAERYEINLEMRELYLQDIWIREKMQNTYITQYMHGRYIVVCYIKSTAYVVTLDLLQKALWCFISTNCASRYLLALGIAVHWVVTR